MLFANLTTLFVSLTILFVSLALLFVNLMTLFVSFMLLLVNLGLALNLRRLQCNVRIEVQSSNTVVLIHSGMKRFNYKPSKNYGQSEFHFRFYTQWNETEGARLLREMRVYLGPRRLKAEEAQGPPAERERLQCNETDVRSYKWAIGIPSNAIT
ncbi:hypothetical protein [Peribacillus muralis]|uniref:hypothetical protein n=1 Tax=Peribacillus muralis TaxID=264697 RepID=UPI00366F0294